MLLVPVVINSTAVSLVMGMKLTVLNVMELSLDIVYSIVLLGKYSLLLLMLLEMLLVL